MNNQHQIPWEKPSEEITPISRSNFLVALQKRIQVVTSQVKKMDQFANSLSSPSASHDNQPRKGISAGILR